MPSSGNTLNPPRPLDTHTPLGIRHIPCFHLWSRLGSSDDLCDVGRLKTCVYDSKYTYVRTYVRPWLLDTLAHMLQDAKNHLSDRLIPTES